MFSLFKPLPLSWHGLGTSVRRSGNVLSTAPVPLLGPRTPRAGEGELGETKWGWDNQRGPAAACLAARTAAHLAARTAA